MSGEKIGRKRLNWWMIAFFVSLLALEIAREMLVVGGQMPAKPNASAIVSSIRGYTTAQGSWARADGGSRLVPSTTSIRCFEQEGTCTEATVQMFDGLVQAPDISVLPAVFSPSAITYENDSAGCATYTVKIDLDLDKAFAVRRLKDKPDGLNCDKFEKRIEMQLSNGYDTYKDDRDKLFLPVFTALDWIF